MSEPEYIYIYIYISLLSRADSMEFFLSLPLTLHLYLSLSHLLSSFLPSLLAGPLECIRLYRTNPRTYECTSTGCLNIKATH